MSKRNADCENGHTSAHLLVELRESGPHVSITEDTPLRELFEDPATLLQLVRGLLELNGSCDSEEAFQRVADGVSAFLVDLRPRNALEGALASQMYACNRLAMVTARRALLDQYVEHTNLAVNQTVKLQRTFALQLEALAKLRGKKTHQEVTVRHVTGDNVVPFPEGGGGAEERTGTSP